ncbi:DUF2071 domain-containing protein [Flavobacterium sp. MFBS3-15]|uniref:DUF2071 domain-containing protein n=1 Tax=Flavobacterium sp. MFBS3-15 TaxID=2989816 RepID=UPI00223672DE|nr:DUF2071 domain-containing protein [Flavobacterium sp. MFBS3-15]MCW4469694.1 DUF2071 domain-containing protein [Flavobacterium sp. MFBS3-15]
MRIPTIHGYIDRRILINYTIDAEVARKVIPAPFRPKLCEGKAIGGICLIRLKHIKPKGLPDLVGIASENGAHRFAVEWDEGGGTKEGVFIPRRDTSSFTNAIAGGRIFPGKHHLAKFDVKEANGNYNIAFTSDDATQIAIEAKVIGTYPENSIFKSLDEASGFFEKGCIGYSPNKNNFDGVCLTTYKWEMIPLEVASVKSSYFENEAMFPKGSVVFDNALLMKNIEHEWLNVASK